jgi:hypothetical protein
MGRGKLLLGTSIRTGRGWIVLDAPIPTAFFGTQQHLLVQAIWQAIDRKNL